MATNETQAVEPERKRGAVKRWAIPAVGVFVFSMFFGGVALAHVVTVPPPVGPYAYYDNPNGMFGLFCARAYIQVSDTGAQWQAGSATSTWYTPNGVPLCDTPLNLAANEIYADAILTKNGSTFCGFDFNYNLHNTPSAAVGFTGCGSSGSATVEGLHEAWLYGQWRTKNWQVTHP